MLKSTQFCRETYLQVSESQLNGKITFIGQIVLINKFNLEKDFFMDVLSNLETFTSFSIVKFISVTHAIIFIIIITIIVCCTADRSRTVLNVSVFRFSRGSSGGASRNKSSTGA